MGENPQKAVADILNNALTPQPEKEETSEQDQQETAPVETLETQGDKPTPEPEKEQEEDISTLNHLAEELDIPIEDMYALNFKMPNGDPVQLGELKDFYEQNNDLEASRQEIENDRSTLKAEKEKLGEVQPASEEHVQALANKLVVEQEWQALESSGLRQSNPGEYAAKAQELQSRYAQATGYLQNINQVLEAKREARMVEQQTELYKLDPDLKDEPKRQQAVARVTNMFQEYGVNPAYLGAIEDPKAIHMLLEISKLFTQKGTLKDKRIDTAPKVLKPEAVKNSQAGKKASIERLTKAARESNSNRAKARAISELIR